MQTLGAFSIQTQSWWVAIGISLVLHVVIIFNFQSEHKNKNSFETPAKLEISLNKYAVPQAQVEAPPEISQKTPQTTTAPLPVSENLRQPKANKSVQPNIVKAKLAPPLKTSQPQVVEKVSRRVIPKTIEKSTPADVSNSLSRQQNTQKIKTDYLAKLATWLNQHKHYPAIARRRGQEGDISVRFSINAAGELLSYQLISPSAHTSLNTAVIKMLQNASPMPTVPAELQNGKSAFDYTIPVHFKLNRNR